MDIGIIMTAANEKLTPLQKARERDRADRAGRKEAERRAGELVSSKRFVGRDELEHALETWVSRKNRDRKRVRPDGWEYVNSDTFGLVKSHSGGVFVSSISNEYPSILEVLGLYVYGIAGKTDFNWTSITVNSDFASSKHRDSGNEGPSIIQAFGPFSGGELMTWTHDNGKKTISDFKDEDATILDARTPQRFDGRKLHGTMPFSGKRTSIVWYTCRCLAEATNEIIWDASRLRLKLPKPFRWYRGRRWPQLADRNNSQPLPANESDRSGGGSSGGTTGATPECPHRAAGGVRGAATLVGPPLGTKSIMKGSGPNTQGRVKAFSWDPNGADLGENKLLADETRRAFAREAQRRRRKSRAPGINLLGGNPGNGKSTMLLRADFWPRSWNSSRRINTLF